MNDISLEMAHKAIDAAVARSAEIECKMDIAVVDAGANLKAFVRMDGAWLGSIDIAMKQGEAPRATSTCPPASSANSVAARRSALRHRALQRRPDHLPRRRAAHQRRAGEVIGAIGVSGSTVENDHDVAMAGLKAVS